MKRSRSQHKKDTPKKKQRNNVVYPDCSICLEIINPPAVACINCFQSFCEMCCLEYQSKSDIDEPPCPLCKASRFEWKNNVGLNTILANRVVHCKFQDRGCTKMIQYQELDSHVANKCKYADIKCSAREIGCKWSGDKKLLGKHMIDCNYVMASEELGKMTEKMNDMKSLLDGLEEKVRVNSEILGSIENKAKTHTDRNIARLQSAMILIKGVEVTQRIVLEKKNKFHMIIDVTLPTGEKTKVGFRRIVSKEKDSEFNIELSTRYTTSKGYFLCGFTALYAYRGRYPELNLIHQGMNTSNRVIIGSLNEKTKAIVIETKLAVLDMGLV